MIDQNLFFSELCSVTSTSRVENLGTVADITTCHVEALVEFCKALPGFTDLPSIGFFLSILVHI